MEKELKWVDSEELKNRLKDKSPEEIAEIVENYYEAKYSSEKLFSGKRYFYAIAAILILAALLAFAAWLSFGVLSINKNMHSDPGTENPGRISVQE